MNRRMKTILTAGAVLIVAAVAMPHVTLINLPPPPAPNSCKEQARGIKQDYLAKGYSESASDHEADSFLDICLSQQH